MVLGHSLRIALLLAALIAPAGAETTNAGPRFRADGPEADGYGRKAGYPFCQGLAYIRDLGCRVGAFSHFDKLYPARVIAAPKSPSPLKRAAAEPAIRYTFDGEGLSLDQYLDRNHVTGFLIAHGETILVERYQYGRTDKQRLTSFSMAKTVIGLLIGIAVGEGAIRSVDEPAETYVPGLKGTEFGRTSIKHLLQMSSGVAFSEDYNSEQSDIYTLAHLTLGQDPGGSLAALKRFNTRAAKPGERFSYSSAESLVLGLVLTGATRRTVSDYAAEKLWGPLGAEADASWLIDGTGQEITFAYVNAVLRDWARLGLMLAHDGAWQGKQIVPEAWVKGSTTIEPGSPFWSSSMKPGDHVPGYGYQVWLMPTRHRVFVLRGLRGQFMIVDPAAKLVVLQTALRNNPRDWELAAIYTAVAAQLR